MGSGVPRPIQVPAARILQFNVGFSWRCAEEPRRIGFQSSRTMCFRRLPYPYAQYYCIKERHGGHLKREIEYRMKCDKNRRSDCRKRIHPTTPSPKNSASTKKRQKADAADPNGRRRNTDTSGEIQEIIVCVIDDEWDKCVAVHPVDGLKAPQSGTKPRSLTDRGNGGCPKLGS